MLRPFLILLTLFQLSLAQTQADSPQKEALRKEFMQICMNSDKTKPEWKALVDFKYVLFGHCYNMDCKYPDWSFRREERECREIFEYESSSSVTQFHKGEISDLSIMRFFPQVEWLSFTDNNVTSLEFVKYLPKLEELHAQLNPIKSIDPLKGKNLKVLKVGSRGSEFNISVLSDMKNLEILRIGGDYDDLSTLANLTKLRELSVRVNPNNLCVINNLVNLRELYIYNSNLTDISCLNNLKGITRLNLDNNRLTSVEDIANNFPNLETLSIEGNPITDLSPLTKLTKLRFLYVDKEKLRDCSPKNDTEIKAGKSCNNSWIRRLYDSLF